MLSGAYHLAARTAVLLMLSFTAIGSVNVLAQENSFVLDRDGKSIVLETYTTNIIRVTLSKTKSQAAAAPGYGFVGSPSMTGWSHEQDSDKDDVFRSGQLVVHVSANHLAPCRMACSSKI